MRIFITVKIREKIVIQFAKEKLNITVLIWIIPLVARCSVWYKMNVNKN